jgi:hypothetical protein
MLIGINLLKITYGNGTADLYKNTFGVLLKEISSYTYKNDFDIKDLELCLKIDKTVEFITLSTKDKKEINNLIT